MKKRDISIDIIKIVASFAVVCLHIIDVPSTESEQIIYYLSGCAIPLLFMTNGYLLLNKEKITFKRQTIKTLQMLVVVFAWCLIYSCLNYLTKQVWVNPIESTFLGLIQKGPMWQFWFIGSLMIIHLFLPIFNKIFKNGKLSLLITIGCLIICFGLDIYNISLVALDQPLIQSYIPQTFRLWNHFAYFFLGGFLGKAEVKKMIKDEISVIKHVILLTIMSVVIVIYQTNMGLQFYGTTYAEFFYDNLFIMIWIIILFTLLNRINFTKPWIMKLVQSTSVNTVGVYAMHLYILKLFTASFDLNNQEFIVWVPIAIFLIANGISQLLRMNKYTKRLITF